MLAPVVLEPMLRNETTLNPEYKFLGGLEHPAKIGEARMYRTKDKNDVKKAQVYDVGSEINTTTITQAGNFIVSYESDGDTENVNVVLEYSENETITPLFMVDKDNFRVSTIGDGQFDTVKAHQYYYVSKNSLKQAVSWIFPNYGSERGWYMYSGSGGDKKYGSQSSGMM